MTSRNSSRPVTAIHPLYRIPIEELEFISSHHVERLLVALVLSGMHRVPISRRATLHPRRSAGRSASDHEQAHNTAAAVWERVGELVSPTWSVQAQPKALPRCVPAQS